MAKIVRNHYVLAVADLAETRRWFEVVLGCVAEEVDPGNWTFMSRDSVVFMLGRCPDAIPVGELGDHQYFAYIVVDDVDAMYEQAVRGVDEAGGEVLKPPTEEPWGMCEMGLRTVDGYRMMVAQAIERSAL